MRSLIALALCLATPVVAWGQSDLGGLPRSQLAVLPGTTHVTLVDRADWLASMITGFLDAPMPKAR
jgi:hypothetical protein